MQQMNMLQPSGKKPQRGVPKSPRTPSERPGTLWNDHGGRYIPQTHQRPRHTTIRLLIDGRRWCRPRDVALASA
eukprot:7360019-Pyramimonas_sp.AAC.1